MILKSSSLRPMMSLCLNASDVLSLQFIDSDFYSSILKINSIYYGIASGLQNKFLLFDTFLLLCFVDQLVNVTGVKFDLVYLAVQNDAFVYNVQTLLLETWTGERRDEVEYL